MEVDLEQATKENVSNGRDQDVEDGTREDLPSAGGEGNAGEDERYAQQPIQHGL